LRQLGWPESLCNTLRVENAALRGVAEAHYREAMEEREPSLYEIMLTMKSC
jgi:hypothetical protein